MKDFVLRLKHRTVLGEKQNLMQREQNILSCKNSKTQTPSCCCFCILSGPHITEPCTCTLYTLAEGKYAHTNRHVQLLFTHTSVTQKTDCKDINSEELSFAQGCREQSLLHHTHTHRSQGNMTAMAEYELSAFIKHTQTIPHTCCTMVVSSRQS